MIKTPTNHKVKSFIQINSHVDNLISIFETKKIFWDDYNIFTPIPKGRPTIFKNSAAESYGLINHPIIEPYSSEGDFDEEENEYKQPSVREVCENIFDPNTLMNIESREEFPKHVNHGLLLTNIDNDMTAIEVKDFLENVPILSGEQIDIYEIRLFRINYINYAFVVYSKKEDCRKIYDFFNDSFKLQNFPTLNSNGDLVRISYCYDLTDSKYSKWFAIVLRNLDISCTKDKIENFCLKLNQGVLYALNPVKIYDTFCSIIVINELDDAEKLVNLLNCKDLREIGNHRKIKAHVHPKCSKLRKNTATSHFSSFYIQEKKKGVNKKANKEILSIHIPLNKITANLIEEKLSNDQVPQIENTISDVRNPSSSKDEKNISRQEILNKLILSKSNLKNLSLCNSITPSKCKDLKNKNATNKTNEVQFIESKIDILKSKKIADSSKNIKTLNRNISEKEITASNGISQLPIEIKNNIFLQNKRRKLNNNQIMFDTIPLGQELKKDETKYYSDFQKMDIKLKKNQHKE